LLPNAKAFNSRQQGYAGTVKFYYNKMLHLGVPARLYGRKTLLLYITIMLEHTYNNLVFAVLGFLLSIYG